MDLPVYKRFAVPGDLNLILSSWLRSFAPDPAISKAVYLKEHEMLIRKVLAHSVTRIEVLCAQDHQDQVFAWVCDQPGVLHYIFVKPAFRRMGLATRLLLPPWKFHTHETEAGRKLCAKFPKSTFDPYLFTGVCP